MCEDVRVSTLEQNCEALQDLRRFVGQRFALYREYTDVGISGAQQHRPQLDMLMKDGQDEQSEVLFDVHALVDTLYIKELGKKTHRGLEGLALRGFHTGGNCYGYRNVRVEGGVRLEVNESEATIIRRIFEMAASGYSLKKIAKTLNLERISPPRPRAKKENSTWCPTAIHAMLRREMYVGRVIWNRSRFVKSPRSNKRVRRPRPRSDWRSIDRPELRIVGDELWDRFQARLAWTRKIYGQQRRNGLLNRVASSQYLLSGIVKCVVCGGNLVITSGRSRRGHRKYGCSQHFYRGACPNGLQIRKDWLEEKLLAGLQHAVASTGSRCVRCGGVLSSAQGSRGKFVA
jgi:site-specific DNA recombinase